MTLPASGAISFNDINVELGVSGTTTRTLNDSAVRTLFGIASGAIDMNTGHGKSNRAVLSYTFASNTPNASLNVNSISGYSAGKSDITITVGSGVYLYATSTGNAGLTLTGGTSGDTVTLVNNGYIMGQGGDGTSAPSGGGAGGPAISLGFNTTIDNTNASAYIGGGGGGGAGNNSYTGGGGGGAGGGSGGGSYAGGGGGIGSSGGNGSYNVYVCGCGVTEAGPGGGGGGRIFPGSGGAGGYGNQIYLYHQYWSGPGYGGGAGGGGAMGGGNNSNRGGDGGSGSSAGGNGSGNLAQPGGGGGWGASGGHSGGAGGNAVSLNGKTVTWVSGNTTRVYGAVA